MNNDEKQFENQIGNLGGEEQHQDGSSMVGKKLRHVPGKQEELNEDEDNDMNEFLNRSRKKSKIVKMPVDEDRELAVAPRLAEGWVEIDRSEMGIRSRFYADDWRFFIRPATVEAIKNWSAIDEERVDVMIEGFNDIVRSCLCIKSSTGNIPWNRINSWDRFWFILKIRQISFKQGEAKIEFTDNCPECEEEITYRLEPENLFYEFPDDEIVEKHWNAYERAWYIDPKDYDLDRPAIKLYVPTIEKDQAILDWGLAKARQKKKIDKKFLDFLPWLLSKAPKDENTLEHLIAEAHMIYKNWDVDMFDFMEDVIRNITINPSENLKQICPHCGEEVVSNVRFPKGIRALFKTEAKHTKFGSR